MSTQRGSMTYVRDGILFCLGVVIILKQAGILFSPPDGGVSLELLCLGALFCNGPLFLSYLTVRRGISGSLPAVPSELPASPLAPPSEQSSEGSA